jgi:hypothetical protein
MKDTAQMARAPETVGAVGALREASKQRQYSDRSTATEAQIQRLLTMLRLAPRHTHELRRSGISHPAGRVLDLIKRGYHIEAGRVTTVDGDGFRHVGVALYSLISEPIGL